MAVFQLLLLMLLIHFNASTPVNNIENTVDSDVLLDRQIRDRDGKFHPAGDHSHQHAHEHNHATAVSVAGPEGVSGLINVNGLELSSFQPFGGDHIVSSWLPPNANTWVNVPPVANAWVDPAPHSAPPSSGYSSKPPMDGPNGYANCGCVVFGQCAAEVVSRMPALLQTLRNDVVCGHKYSLCCLEDPWAGPIDQWADHLPCVPEEECVRKYGDDPYDIQNYGVIGPCLGLGSVRCLDDKPSTIIVPIIDPFPPTIPVPPTEPTVYEPPPTSYGPPVEAPPTSYGPPVEAPPTSYGPPEPTYEPPSPSYVAPVATYEAPATSYVAPVATYEAPATSYVAPVATYEAPATSYVAPVATYQAPVATGLAHYSHLRYPGRYGGGFSKYGYGGGFWNPFLGYGFRKRFHYSKSFFG